MQTTTHQIIFALKEPYGLRSCKGGWGESGGRGVKGVELR